MEQNLVKNVIKNISEINAGKLLKIFLYAKELEQNAKDAIKWKGSSVTSMAEDFEIIAIGKETKKIARKIKKIINE